MSFGCSVFGIFPTRPPMVSFHMFMRDVRDLINKPNVFRDLHTEVDVDTCLSFLELSFTKLHLLLFKIVERLLQGFMALFKAKCI